jgi:hypothetical protein
VLSWSVEEQCLYSGDDSGRVRKWDARPLLDHLVASGLLAKDGEVIMITMPWGGLIIYRTKSTAVGERS